MITYELIIEGDMIYNFSVYPLDVLEWNPYNVDCSVRDRKDDQRGVNRSQIKISPPEAIWSSPKCTPKPSSPR